MQINRRSFLANFIFTGAALLYPASYVSAQPQYSEIFGIADLRYYILRLEEDGIIHPNLFSGKVGNRTVRMTTNGAMTLVDYISLDTEIDFNENGSELELRCYDWFMKGYIEGIQPGDYIHFDIKKDDEIESGVFDESGEYVFYHYRKLRNSEKVSESDEVHHRHHNFIQDGYAFYDGERFRYPFFHGVYEHGEGNIWKVQEALSKKSQEGFRYAHKIYRETLQQVILELEKHGKLVLAR